MIDDDDVSFFVLVWPFGGPILSLIGIALFIWLMVAASNNENACEARVCGAGSKARLLDGECVCASEPK